MLPEIKDPIPVFFALFFKNTGETSKISVSNFIEFFTNTKNFNILNLKMKNKILYYLYNEEFTPNDLGISLEDYSIFNDIIYLSSPEQIFNQVYVGILSEETPKINLKWKKGTFNREDFLSNTSVIIDALYNKINNIDNMKLKNRFISDLSTLTDNQNNLRIM